MVRFGKPLDFSRYEGLENDRYILRSITDEIMYEIMRLSGQEYVDMYASVAKEEQKKADQKAAAGDRPQAPRPVPTRRPPDPMTRRAASAAWPARPHGPVQDTLLRALGDPALRGAAQRGRHLPAAAATTTTTPPSAGW